MRHAVVAGVVTACYYLLDYKLNEVPMGRAPALPWRQSITCYAVRGVKHKANGSGSEKGIKRGGCYGGKIISRRKNKLMSVTVANANLFGCCNYVFPTVKVAFYFVLCFFLQNC